MAIEPGRWLKLNPATIKGIPDAPGIFEIANLVRSVLFIGSGEGSLRSRLATLTANPMNLPASTGGYYVRYELTTDEQMAAAERAAAFQSRHQGRVPAGNGSEPRPVRLVTRRAA